MDISLRNLFSQNNIPKQIISINRSLANHFQPGNSIRNIHTSFSRAAPGNGYSCGCKKDDSLKIDFGVSEKKLGQVVPAWVSAALSDKRTGSNTRTVEGILTLSKMTHTDFPLRPWHFYYDWNYYVEVDKQYFYLNSPANHGFDKLKSKAIMECEWDTNFLPEWAWPMFGDRVKIIGRWIYDCGHPENGKHRSEIHPPKAVISFRSETFKFKENKGRARANQAVVFMNDKGGYFNQKINDQNYDFDLYLPPKPIASATPVWNVRFKASTKVNPVITPYPEKDPKLLKVHIPLKGKTISDGMYGAIISGGWKDSKGIDDFNIRKIYIKINEAHLKDKGERGRDEWYVYVGVNGRWKKILSSKDSGKHKINHIVSLYLHKADKIKIAACGMEADPIHDLMGKNTGISPSMVSSGFQSSSKRKNAAKNIRNKFLALGAALTWGGDIENDPIGIIQSVLGINKRFILTPNTASRPKDRFKFKNKYSITVSTSTRVIPNASTAAYYFLQAHVSGHHLDVKGGSLASGVTVWQYLNNGSSAQKWRLEKVPGSVDIFRIISHRSKKCLSLKASGINSNEYAKRGVLITQYPKAIESKNPLRFYSQQWRLIPNGNYYIIVNILTGYALDVRGSSKESGVEVWQYTRNKSAAQNWKFVPTKR